VFDEFHNLFGQHGATWETMVALTPSPFLALSATIANPHRLEAWLKPMQKSKGKDVKCIPSLDSATPIERYNDLSMHLWGPVGETPTDRIVTINPIGSVRGDELAVLNRENRPLVLSMAPEQCMVLYDALAAVAAGIQPDASTIHIAWAEKVTTELEPSSYFSSRKQIELNSSREWGNLLKQQLVDLYSFAPQLAVNVTNFFHNELDSFFEVNADNFTLGALDDCVSRVCSHQMAMVRDLQAKEMLPCIIFNMTDDICIKFALSMAAELKAAEDESKEKTGDEKKESEKRTKKLKEVAKKQRKEVANCRDSKMKRELEGDVNETEGEIAGPGGKIDLRYTILKKAMKAITPVEIIKYLRLPPRTKQQQINEDPLLHALQRGIGVHCHTVTPKYREAVEYFFREDRLSVIFSTETLAQGMNMPAKTVVFAGDHPTLNTVNYTQMSGRAGRRGLDDRGNVLHFFIPQAKVERLMAGHLPMHSGHTTLSPTNVMKLVHLETGCRLRNNDKQADDSINSMFESAKRLLEFPYKSVLKEVDVDRVDRLARMGNVISVAPSTIELNSRKLLIYFTFTFMQEEQFFTKRSCGKRYTPLPITGLVSLIHEHHPVNFVVVALLRSGVIQDFVTDPELFDKNSPDVTHRRDMALIHIFAHLYGRVPAFMDESVSPQALGEQFAGVSGEYATKSMQFEQPAVITTFLESYNKRVLGLLTSILAKFQTNFVRTEGGADLPCQLPSSGIVLPAVTKPKNKEGV
jgi:hypothetical protein